MADFTDEQLESLSEEERAALEEEDENIQGEGDDEQGVEESASENDEEGEEDSKSKETEEEADEKEVEGREEEKSEDKFKEGSEEEIEAKDKTEEQKGEPAEPPPANPLFKLDAGTDGKTLEDIDADLQKLDEQFEEGDIPLKDYNSKRDALNQAKFRLAMYEDINKQVAVQFVENNWKAAQKEFFADNPAYQDDQVLNAAFVHVVNGLLATDEGKKMTDRQVLMKARETVEESLWIFSGKANEKDDGEKEDRAKKDDSSKDNAEKEKREVIAAAKKKEAQKGHDSASLAKMPLAESLEGGDKFDVLDKLTGEEFENAIAALSDSERKTYARRG